MTENERERYTMGYMGSEVEYWQFFSAGALPQ